MAVDLGREAVWWFASTVAAAVAFLLLHQDTALAIGLFLLPLIRLDVGYARFFQAAEVRPLVASVAGIAVVVGGLFFAFVPLLLVALVPLMLAPGVVAALGGSFVRRRFGWTAALAGVALCFGPLILPLPFATPGVAFVLLGSVVAAGVLQHHAPRPAQWAVPLLYGYAAGMVFFDATPYTAVPAIVLFGVLQWRGAGWWSVPALGTCLLALDPLLPNGWWQKGVLSALFLADVAFVAWRRGFTLRPPAVPVVP